MGDSCQDPSGPVAGSVVPLHRSFSTGSLGLSHSLVAGFQEQVFQEILGKDARCPVAWSQKTKNDKEREEHGDLYHTQT